MAKLLVTGGAGFIGSNFIRFWSQKHPSDTLVNLDLLTYAGSKDTSLNGSGRRVEFVKGNIGNAKLAGRLAKGAVAIIHFAAETHVDRSILDSQIFLKTNVLGTQTLLEAAKKNGVKKFVFISTDEVYGSIERGSFTEESPLMPNSPYAASKASADLLCRSYWATYGLPVLITRCCNNFGPHQFPEKVIPLFITNLMEGKKIPLYGKGANVREWLDVMDHASAVECVLQKGKPGEIYNVGSGFELNNLDLARRLLKHFGKSEDFIEPVQDRPGHDLRYSVNSSKLRGLGWKPEKSFEESLVQTIQWYRENEPWWKTIKQKSRFRTYMKKQYAGRGK